jgi:cell division inhibitor SulA/protein ImuA
MKASIAELTQFPGVWRGGELERVVHATVATGHAALDRELPGGGWPVGTLSEVLHDGVGLGEVSFLGGALARACEGDRLGAWINPPHLPYAPALAQAGVPLDRCLVVRPANREDALWAAEQALRSGACGAVLFWLGSEGKNEYACLRRLQMAAAAGRSMAVFFRSTAAEKLSTPAHLRVVLAREGGVLKARIPKRRGPPLLAPVTLGLARKTKAAVPAMTERARTALAVVR